MAQLATAQVPRVVKWISVSTDRDALLFAPGDEVSVSLKIAKGSGTTVTWEAVDQKEKQLAASTSPVRLSADTPTDIDISLGKLSEGLYVIRLVLHDGDAVKDRTAVPVAVLNPPSEGAKATADDEPFFPMGVYDKFIINRDPVIQNTYLHALCWTLSRNGLNCMTSGNSIYPGSVEQMEIARRWGIKVLIRTDWTKDPQVLSHPNAVALMYGDEPELKHAQDYKKQYDEVAANHPDKIMLTCMVGDGAGKRESLFDVWDVLQPKVRFVRYYPIRRGHYDMSHARLASGALPASAVFQMIDSYSDTPWWFVTQTFGEPVTETRPEAHWGNPTPAELSALTHMALAHGAKGIVGWALQTHWQKGYQDVPCMLTQETLVPEDEKWDAFLKITGFVNRFKHLLATAQKGNFEPAAERAELEVVPRQSGETRLIYVVNKDSRNAVESDLWLFRSHVMAIRDLVDDKELPLRVGEWDRPTARIKLAPGEGRLYQVDMVTGPITADRIDVKEVLPIKADPIRPPGPGDTGAFKQVQALPGWWRFSTDPQDVGNDQGWFKSEFDDSGWNYLRVGKFWDEQGIKYEKAPAWYRTSFVPDAATTSDASKPLKLLFMGVDESAWVYLNGEHVLTHYPDSTDGWDRGFTIDVAGKLKPGEPNVIAVRVLSRTMAGGIYGKVALVTPAANAGR